MASLLVASLAACALAVPPATTLPDWSFPADQDIVFFRLTPLGSLVVSTGAGLVGVDPASGAPTWRRDDLRGLPGSRFQTVPGSATALVNVPAGAETGEAHIELLDLGTGAARWDSRALGIGEALGHLFVPHRRLVVMYTVPPGESSGTWQDGRGPWTFVAVDVATGRLAWVTDRLVRAPPLTTRRWGSDGTPVRSLLGAGRGMVFDSDSTAILDLSREGPVRLDLASGRRLWPAALRESLDTGGTPGTARMAVDDRAVYAPRRGRLQALSLGDGRVLWEQPVEAHALRMTPRGLLVCTSAPYAGAQALALGAAAGGLATAVVGLPLPGIGGMIGDRLRARHLDLLDPRTGDSRWPRPFELPERPKESRSRNEYAPFDVRGDTVYVGDYGRLRGVRLTDGVVLDLARFGVNENEWPEALEARASGVLLRTRDALVSLDPTTGGRYGPYGATRFTSPRLSPGLPSQVAIGASLLVVGLVALLVHSALTDVQDAYANAYGPVFGPVAATLGGVPQGLVVGGAVGAIAGVDYVLSTRFQRSQEAAAYHYELSTVRDARGVRGPGIVRVDKDTGKVEGQVMLRRRGAGNTTSADRSPVFEVDDIEGRLYHQDSPRTIVRFTF